MRVGDMVRPVPFGPTRGSKADPWLNRVGIIVGFEEERDYAGVTVVYMPVVYWGNDFTAEVEYREQVEVISVATSRNKSNIVEGGRSSESMHSTDRCSGYNTKSSNSTSSAVVRRFGKRKN